MSTPFVTSTQNTMFVAEFEIEIECAVQTAVSFSFNTRTSHTVAIQKSSMEFESVHMCVMEFAIRLRRRRWLRSVLSDISVWVLAFSPFRRIPFLFETNNFIFSQECRNVKKNWIKWKKNKTNHFVCVEMDVYFYL